MPRPGRKGAGGWRGGAGRHYPETVKAAGWVRRSKTYWLGKPLQGGGPTSLFLDRRDRAGSPGTGEVSTGGKRMTFEEWLEADHEAISEYFHERLSPRTLRLFLCACVRRVWHLLSDERSRRAVEVTERLADGQASQKEQEAAREAAFAVVEALKPRTSEEAAAWAASEALGIDTDADWANPTV